MLDGAFLHLDGIGPKKWTDLQRQGIATWDHALEKLTELIKGEKAQLRFRESLIRSKIAKENLDLEYITNSFHPADKWRILAEYWDSLSFFDIETDGLYNRITVIGCLHKGQNYSFVKGENLDEFLDFLEETKILVSFNGSSFDIPCILKYFHIPKFPVPHIDIRWVLYHSGYKGSLKSIEKQMGISRESDLEGVDGMEAVRLWFQYTEWGDLLAKEKLIRYCLADVNSLEILSSKIINDRRNK